MKNILFIILAVAFAVACNTADKKVETEKDKHIQDSLTAEQRNEILQDTSNVTTIQWLDSTSLDMGKVKEGQVVEVAFRFKNSGNKPLVITNVSASCGCTVPEKPQQPFAPGEEGVIRAKFDSKGRSGVNNKQVYVTANSVPNSFQLSFSVDVTQ